jgi:hypothetical protein
MQSCGYPVIKVRTAFQRSWTVIPEFLKDGQNRCSPVMVLSRISASLDGDVESKFSACPIPRSSISVTIAFLQSCRWSQLLQSPSCLYQTWTPFRAEKVTIACVLNSELWPTSTPLTAFKPVTFILLSLAVSMSACAIFVFAPSTAL